MTENKNVETILKNGDKALSGMPYLYRSKGLPSEVYDVRMRKGMRCTCIQTVQAVLCSI